MELYKQLACKLPNDAKYNVNQLDGARILVTIKLAQNKMAVTFVPQHLGYIPYVQGLNFNYARVLGYIDDLDGMVAVVQKVVQGFR